MSSYCVLAYIYWPKKSSQNTVRRKCELFHHSLTANTLYTSKANVLHMQLDNYVGPVPTFYAAFRLTWPELSPLRGEDTVSLVVLLKTMLTYTRAKFRASSKLAVSRRPKQRAAQKTTDAQLRPSTGRSRLCSELGLTQPLPRPGPLRTPARPIRLL